MFFENLGGIGNKSRDYIIKQSVVAVHAVVDAIANDELSSVDPDRWDEISDRGGWIRTSDGGRTSRRSRLLKKAGSKKDPAFFNI